jgi:hypothetical protein
VAESHELALGEHHGEAASEPDAHRRRSSICPHRELNGSGGGGEEGHNPPWAASGLWSESNVTSKSLCMQGNAQCGLMVLLRVERFQSGCPGANVGIRFSYAPLREAERCKPCCAPSISKPAMTKLYSSASLMAVARRRSA